MTGLPLIVVQCRYGSTRLPGKCELPLGQTNMLTFLLRRLAPLRDNAQLVLATTDRPEDDVVALRSREEGVAVIRGEVDDVLARYIRCLDAYPADAVVRVTADNPLTCPEQLLATVGWLEEHGAEYCMTEGLPVGTASDAFSTAALRRVHEQETDPACREHINKFFLQRPGRAGVAYRPAPDPVNRPDLSLTVDTTEEYKRMCVLIESLGPEPWRTSLAQAIQRLDSFPVR